ncbi:MAG: CheR family methyltransferase [Bacillota bacterium]|uniref:CheR family methyltransferase n=1 Tax=Desulfurispora thermophila TaxID=265470 RepID=UPI000363E011|nr:protein-glutamate O-methyltransferase CheR [Desulfurispora thermophila]
MSGAILNAADFTRLAEFIYQKTGIRFGADKNYYVTKRVEKRMQELGFKSFSLYFNHLRFHSAKRELEFLVNSLTVNETYFFREYMQLKCFAEEVIPLLAQNLRGSKLKVWSAGCSTGEEPYTLAIILLEMLGDTGMHFEVHGTDINTEALKSAERAYYGARAVKDVPVDYLQKYFRFDGNGYWVRPDVKKRVCLYRLNLMDREAMERMSGFHAVFCRNVLIYFDDHSRREVALGFYRSLEPGGFIFLGHSESMSRITPIFKLRRFKEAIIYQK